MATVQQVKEVSTLGTINWKDVGKGVIVAVLTAFIATVGQSVSAGAFPTLLEFKTALLAGGTAGIAYLIKQLTTGPVKTDTAQ